MELLVHGVWCMVYGVRCMAYNVQCTVYGVQCTVCGVRCTVVWSSMWGWSLSIPIISVDVTMLVCSAFGLVCVSPFVCSLSSFTKVT